MILLLPWTLALATPDREVPANERTVLLQQTWQGAPLALAIGPCTRLSCPISVARGSEPDAPWVFLHDLGGVEAPRQTLTVGTVEEYVSVRFDEYSSATVRWKPIADIAGNPTLEVYMEAGDEHVSHGWVLLSLVDGVLWPVWSDWARPRYAGWTTYDVVREGDKPVVITQVTNPIQDDAEHETVERTTYEWDESGFLVGEVDVPWWLLIAATTDSVAEALKRRDAASCLHDFAVLSTADFPRLTPGKTILARVATSKEAAEALSADCVDDAYVKRGR